MIKVFGLRSTSSLAVVLTGILLHLQPAIASGCDLPMFAGARLFAAGAGPNYIATGDFNHDGKIDVVVTSSGANTVSVQLSNGDGTFSACRQLHPCEPQEHNSGRLQP